MTPFAEVLPTLSVKSRGHLPVSGLELAAVLIVLGFIVACACLMIWVAYRSPGEDDDGRDDYQGGGGGRGPWPPRPSPEGEPDWWPEFERQLTAYLRRGDAGQRLSSRGGTAP